MRTLLQIGIFGGCLLTLVAHGDAALEGELFGDPSPTAPTQEIPQQPASSQGPRAGADSQPSTTLGGRADLLYSVTRQDSENLGLLSTRALPAAFLYLDSRPRDDTRAYLRFSLVAPSTRSSARQGLGAAGSSGAQGVDSNPTLIQLLELWGKWQPSGSPVFWTLGRQPIRWGPSQFWNPTDFMSPETRDPLAIYDDRSGVDALRLNIPFESQNAALILVTSLMPRPASQQDTPLSLQASSGTQARDLQFAARAEWSQGAMESALTLAWSDRGPTRTGISMTAGLGPFDVTLEGACTARTTRTFFERRSGAGDAGVQAARRDQTCLPQGVGGLSWQPGFGDADSLTLGAEYFWNGLGHETPDLELVAALAGQATPLAIGQQYVAAYGLLPAPGSWDDTSFQVQWITNLTDASSLVRGAIVHEILDNTSLVLATTWRDGVGEFRLREGTIQRTLQSIGASSDPNTPAAPVDQKALGDLASRYAQQTPQLQIDASISLSL